MELGTPGGPGGPASGLEYTELCRPLPNSPEEYVVLEDRTEPMRFSCRWNQFFFRSTSGVSTLSCNHNRRFTPLYIIIIITITIIIITIGRLCWYSSSRLAFDSRRYQIS
jgi:hypothetical protein